MAVTLYTKKNCVQCTGTKRKLDKEGVEYETVDISAAYDDRKGYTEDQLSLSLNIVGALKFLGHQQMPVVIVSRPGEEDVHWSGNQPAMIERYCREG